MREASSGRSKSLDEEDEKFIQGCIENKATSHGRRHDAVLYMNHRVKKNDFLKLANYSRHSISQPQQFTIKTEESQKYPSTKALGTRVIL